jgi:hypothetical protein
LKILVLADCPPLPNLTTGFGRVAYHLCLAFHEAGHEIVQFGINYRGEFHDYPWQIIQGAKDDPLGVEWLPIALAQPWDAVVALNDAWVLRQWHSVIHVVTGQGDADPVPFYGYFPVDCDGWPSEWVDTMHLWAGVATYAQFGAEVIREAGYQGNAAIIPHGQDPTMADDDLRASLPEALGPSPWIVLRTDVNRRRKRYDLTISEFCEFAKDKPLPPHPKAPLLWLHCADEGDDLPIRDWYARCLARTGVAYDQRPLLRSATNNPSAHPYLPDDVLRRLYATANVYFTTTEAEGWGLCMTEAAQQGALIVAGRNSVLSELWDGCALLVEPSGIRAETCGAMMADAKGRQYPKRLAVNYPVYTPGAYAQALDRAYRDNGKVRRLRQAGLAKWRNNPDYDWPRIRGLFRDWVCQ